MVWFFTFFLISGFCSILYEVVWLRLAMAQFGVTSALASIVISVFMAGLGLGSWGSGRLIRNYDNRVRVPALRLVRPGGIVDRHIGPAGALPVVVRTKTPGVDRSIFLLGLLSGIGYLDRAHPGSVVRLHGSHDTGGHACDPPLGSRALATIIQLSLPVQRTGRGNRSNLAPVAD